ncbi:DUF3413 domain-containing protein [bacterium]|nr:MAG: DUF3413 domain-containing protein [bacterium]
MKSGFGNNRKANFGWLGRFTVFTTLGFIALLWHYTLEMPPFERVSARLFIALALPGHGFSLALLASGPAALLNLFFPNRKAVTSLGILSALALAFTVLVDTAVFKLYRFHLNGMVWELLTGGAAEEVLPLSAKTLLFSATVLVATGAVLAFGAWLLWRPFMARRSSRPVFIVLFVCLVAVNFLHSFADAKGAAQVVRQVRFLPGFKPLTARKMMKKLGVTAEAAEIDRVRVSQEGTLKYPLEKLSPPSPGKKPNIMLIMVDSWRGDALDPAVTPNIWRFAKDSLVFENHVSSGNATRFGVFGFFYGVPANYWHALLAEQTPAVMIEAAKESGYDFGIFASAPLTSPEFDRTVFSSIRDKIPLSTEGENAVERDEEITRRFRSFLDGSKEPFFSFLFYDAPHSYDFPKGWKTPFTPYVNEINHLELSRKTDPAPYYNKMKNSYNFVDGEVGQVLGELEKRGLLENTVVMITGDHGEEFNDGGLGLWGHNSAFSRPQTRVPLVVRWPGKGAGKINRLTSHSDVAPTVVGDILGYKNPASSYSNGRSLFDESRRDFVITGSWDSFALAGEGFITVALPTGELEYRDSGYNFTSPSPASSKAMIASMEEMSRFFAK